MGAKMFDGDLAKAAGINQSVKYVNKNTAVILPYSERREKLLTAFRIMDEQDAVNRYQWFNIPFNLSSQEIERIIYYKGQVCAFYYKDTGEYYLMPYALSGSIDFYGRYNTVHPIPFAQGTEGSSEEEKKESELRYKNQKEILSRIFLKCVYDIQEEEASEEEIYHTKYNKEGSATRSDGLCVLLNDYTKQRSELIIPRSVVNEVLLNEMADTVSYFDTALLTGSGVEGYRVESASAKEEIKTMASAMYTNAINRTPYVAIASMIDIQELSSGKNKYGVQEFLMAFQGLDNMRLSTYGIANGGVYEKQAHILESEMAINNSNMYSPMEDGTKLRQRFCNIFNSIFGTSLWCEPAEAVVKMDLNGDGVDYDREVDPEEVEGGEEE